MFKPVLRDAFVPMLISSLLIHAGLLAWVGRRDGAMPRPFIPQRGRFSIHLEASVAAVSKRPEPKREALPPPPPTPQPERPTPERPNDVKLPPLKEWLIAAAAPAARRLASRIAEASKKVKTTTPTQAPAPRPKEETSPTPSRPSPRSVASEGADVEEMPRIVTNPAPRYPVDALTARIQGVVVLRVAIGADGKVTSASVYRSSGVASLDEAALTTVRTWQFAPAKRRGIAVAKEVAVPVRFAIKDR